jgi:hypothetical protein
MMILLVSTIYQVDYSWWLVDWGEWDDGCIRVMGVGGKGRRSLHCIALHSIRAGFMLILGLGVVSCHAILRTSTINPIPVYINGSTD